MNGLALCAGIGGIELGLKRVLGERYRTVCYVEREAFCAATLVERMEKQDLDKAPLWDDIRTFDAKPWRGVVDIISGGYPCQPFSTAGNRAGPDDPRHLWPDIRRILKETGAPWLFCENVPGHLSMGFNSVLSELESDGFRVAADVFSAWEVGAGHRRERLFILAHRNGSGLNVERYGRLHQHPSQGKAFRNNAHRQSGTAMGKFPPGPIDHQEWEKVDPRLKPSLCRVAHGIPNRVDRVRALGNTVVPEVSAMAFVELSQRILSC